MQLNNKTLEKLRKLINEETEYRSGPKLISFFEEFGFKDNYGQGFPSRWVYTDNKLNKLNGTSDMIKCIKILFNPINYIGYREKLKSHISEFNEYLAFDGCQIVLRDNVISIKKILNDDSESLLDNETRVTEEKFLESQYPAIVFSDMGIDKYIHPILEQRFYEAKMNLKYKSALSAIFQCGSILEGILFSLTKTKPAEFNTAKSAAKDVNGKVKKFNEWTLSNLIDTSFEIGLINEDVKKFSHVLRDYRNYIHPYQQLLSKFNPDMHTAEICFQVLNAACAQITLKHQIK